MKTVEKHGLSSLRRTLCPTRIAPIYALKQVTQLRRRNRHRFARTACRPDEFSRLKSLQVKRRPHSIVPEDLDKIASTPSKAEDLPSMRITSQTLLDL